MNAVHNFNIVNILGAVMNLLIRISSLLLIFLSVINFAQSNSALEDYIKEGLKNNIVLQQKKISYEKASYALKNATSLFFPTVSILASYTHGQGGRSIAIPVGDLMNPVYQTLNQLTNSNSFPQIQNVDESFFPNKFYDTKFRTSMPILNTDIIFNREIQKNQLQIKEYEVDMYKKELVKEIKTAYYNYLSSLEAVNIYKSASELTNEAKRVNESLLKNGSGLQVYVLRAESEIENLNSLLLEAETKSQNSKKYFNFLLNKSFDSPVETPASLEIIEGFNIQNDMASLREEIKMLNQAVEINKSLLNMNKYSWIPKISGFLDLGAQDSNWKFNQESRYYLFGIQLEVPIFEGFRNSNNIQSASLDVHSAELELEKTAKALNLSLSIAKDELLTAKQNYLSAQKQLKAAQNYNKLIEKGFKEGINSFIESVDARNELTKAMMLVNINRNKVLIAQAALERETSETKINY